jgi:hypothetical protein
MRPPMLHQTERLGQLLTRARMSSHLQLRMRKWSLVVLWKPEGVWFLEEAAEAAEVGMK